MIIKLRSGQEVRALAGETILDACLRANSTIAHSCTTGQCGACKITILEGEILEVADQLSLTPEDRIGGKVLSCCCRPVSNLKIDAEAIDGVKNYPKKRYVSKIKSINRISEDLVEVILRLPPSAEFKFLAGQFIDIIREVRRSYSVASSPESKDIRLVIKRFENGVLSKYWFDEAKVDDIIRFEGPCGTFFLRDVSPKLLMIATGTGIAPIISMLEDLEKNKREPRVRITLLWGNRNANNFFWNPTFENIDVKFIRICSAPDLNWKGPTGYVQDNLQNVGQELSNCAAYACGSLSMIESVYKALPEFGLNTANFYSDAFVSTN